MQSFALLNMLALAAAQSSSLTNVGPPTVTTPTLITATGSPNYDKYSCPKANANYCSGGPIIIQCDASGLGSTTNCNDMLAAEQRSGSENAICYDAMPGDGKAVCALNGTAYASSSTYAISTSAPATPTTNVGPPTVTTPTLITATGSPNYDKYSCPKANANYCAGGPILIECNAEALGSTTNCNDMLARYQTNGTENAVCYDPMVGDGLAACALSGTVYGVSTTYVISSSASPATQTVPTTITTTVSCSSSSPAISVPAPSLVSTSSAVIFVSGPSPTATTPAPASTSASILSGEAAGKHVGAGLAAAVGVLALAL